MQYATRLAVCALMLLAPVGAQQTNTFLASLQVNGNAGPPWPINGVPLPVGVPSVGVISGGPGLPFVLFAAPSLLPSGISVLGGELLDVDIAAGGFVILDGVANPVAFNTGPTGSFITNYVVPGGTALGTSIALQCLVADPSNTPYGARLTAAALCTVTQGVTVTPLTPPTNGGVVFDFTPFGLTFPYYSNTYTQMFVNTDGNITFGSASGDFTPTPTEFRTGPPRIAPFWTNLALPSPGASIAVTVTQSPFAGPFPTVTVAWTGLPSGAAVHTFSAALTMTTGDVALFQGAFNVAPGATVLVGITPGGNLTPPGGTWPVQSNLSAFPLAPTQGLASGAFWEWFGLTGGTMPFYTAATSNPFDLTGVTNSFIALSAGTSLASFYAN